MQKELSNINDYVFANLRLTDSPLCESKFGMTFIPNDNWDPSDPNSVRWYGVFDNSGGISRISDKHEINDMYKGFGEKGTDMDVRHFQKQEGFDTEEGIDPKHGIKYRPTVFRLGKTGLDCYGLFQCSDLYFQKAIKKNLWTHDDFAEQKRKENKTIEDLHKIGHGGKELEQARANKEHLKVWGQEGKVEFIDGADEKFMKESAKELAKIIISVGKHIDYQNRNGIDALDQKSAENISMGIGRDIGKAVQPLAIKYIVWPQSSSTFNARFCGYMRDYFDEIGIKPVPELKPGYFVKSKSGIVVDEEVAAILGLDGDEVMRLHAFILEQEERYDMFGVRKAVDALINKSLSEEEVPLGGTNEYQYMSNSDKRINDQKSSMLYSKELEFFQKRKAGQQEKSKRKKDKETVDLYGADEQLSGKSVELSKTFIAATYTLRKYMERLRNNYQHFKQKLDELEYRRGEYKSKFAANWKDDEGNAGVLHSRTRDESGRLIDQDTKFRVSALDADVERDNQTGKAKLITTKAGEQKNWEIKQWADPMRKTLTKLFSINDNTIDIEREKDRSILVIFDDDVAGGGTFEDVCKTAGDAGWKHIIPCTLMFMRVTDGNNPRDGAHGTNRKSFISNNPTLPSGERRILSAKDAEERRNILGFGDDEKDGQIVSNTFSSERKPFTGIGSWKPTGSILPKFKQDDREVSKFLSMPKTLGDDFYGFKRKGRMHIPRITMDAYQLSRSHLGNKLLRKGEITDRDIDQPLLTDRIIRGRVKKARRMAESAAREFVDGLKEFTEKVSPDRFEGKPIWQSEYRPPVECQPEFLGLVKDQLPYLPKDVIQSFIDDGMLPADYMTGNDVQKPIEPKPVPANEPKHPTLKKGEGEYRKYAKPEELEEFDYLYSIPASQRTEEQRKKIVTLRNRFNQRVPEWKSKTRGVASDYWLQGKGRKEYEKIKERGITKQECERQIKKWSRSGASYALIELNAWKRKLSVLKRFEELNIDEKASSTKRKIAKESVDELIYLLGNFKDHPST